MIQGNTYELTLIKRLVATRIVEAETYKQFRDNIYKPYVQIRNVRKPKACMKYSLEKVKANLRDHWLEIYCKLTKQ
ncbi:hypothetical protein CON22_27975 [Bacillus cereus]|nr:hypothetical protein CON22_27975 [Bacillus cereus]